MALYLNNVKYKINLNGKFYRLNLFSTMPITNGVRLITSDNYILKDSNGIYITAKEEG